MSWVGRTVASVAAGVLATAIFGSGAAVAGQPASLARQLPGDTLPQQVPVDRAEQEDPIGPPAPVDRPPRRLTPDPEPQQAPVEPAAPEVAPQDKAPTSALVGYDVSWPQCGEKLPTLPAFAIVGVTGGLANNTNPCFADQLAWAHTSTGATGQPRVALYVNTANPGLASTSWPTSNTYAGTTISNPYGTCAGANDAACAYVYGWAKAFDDVYLRGVVNPEQYLWWLDVETENTWQDDQAANAADLEGMTAYFESIGAQVGLYSTGQQWWQIVGTVGPESNLYDLPSWLAGARTLLGAKWNCSLAPLTAGGRVTMTQYLYNNLDHNHSCI